MLRKHFASEHEAVATRLPGRSVAACMARARHIGATHGKWSEEENETLRRFYPLEGKKVTLRFPYRTTSACLTQASRLGLKVHRRKKGAKRSVVNDC